VSAVITAKDFAKCIIDEYNVTVIHKPINLYNNEMARAG
jgi:hypothetical protein